MQDFGLPSSEPRTVGDPVLSKPPPGEVTVKDAFIMS